MFGVHSLAPAKLYAGSERKPAPKSKSVMSDVQTAVAANGHAASPHANDSTQHVKGDMTGPDATIRLVQQPSHEPRDSGVGSVSGSQEFSQPEHERERPSHNTTEPAPWMTGASPGPHEQQHRISHNSQEPTSSSSIQPGDSNKNNSAPISVPKPPPAEVGPSSQIRTGSSHSSLQHDAPLASAVAAPPRPDETHFNAIAYRRDPETVIAYLVPLPQPTLHGTTVPTEPRYFLYAPPPPHLLKPRPGASEGYVRNLNRHWQQHVRRAHRHHTNANDDHKNGSNKRAAPAHKRIHGALVRSTTWALGKLQADDVTFLARIHPATVNHLILIHPWGLAGAQTPEEVMRTFRAQMFASKARAKRNSILSAVFFLPALAIDTAAVFFGGMAEVDGIWMLVSVTAYRTARFITRKMGPEPKTLEIEQAKLIEDAKRNGFPPPEPEADEDKEPGAVRRSVDALRRSIGSVKYRISMNQRRSRSRRRRGGETSSTDTSLPRTTDASRTDLEAGFSGGELANHAEEETDAPATTTFPAASPHSLELSGFLEHMDEEVLADEQPGSSGGVLASDSEEHRSSVETSESGKSKKGQNFQLTFYPSPAMEVLARYVQESCHMKNGPLFASSTPVPTEEDVLAVVGWRPERREHDTPEEQADDEEWQTRYIKDDLRQASRKAAKAWNKSCRQQAKQQRRSKKGSFLTFSRPAKASKGKAKETSPSDDEPQQPSEKMEGRSAAAIKARMAAVRSKVQRKPVSSDAPAVDAAAETQDEGAAVPVQQVEAKKDKRGRAAGAAAIMCVPCFAITERVNYRRKSAKKEEPSEARADKGGAARLQTLKQRLSSKRDARRQRKATGGKNVTQRGAADAPAAPVGLETPTDIDGPLTDTEGQTTAVATDVEDQTDVEDNAARPKENKSVKGRLLAIPAAIAAAIGAVLKKRRDAQKSNKTTDASDGDEGKKPSRFSVLQERFRARRTRVSKKKEPARSKQSGASGSKEWFKELNRKRKSKSAAKTKSPKTKSFKTAKEDKPKGAKEHGAVVGLVASCVALPVAKIKQARDKRYKPAAITTDTTAVVTGTPLSPVPEKQQQRAANSGSSTLAPSATSATATAAAAPDDPTISHQPPVVEEEFEDPPEEVLNAGQYLPGHGQSEVPVRPGPPDAMASSDTAVEQTAAVKEPQQSRAQVAVEKLKAARAGLVNRARATGEGADQATGKKESEPVEGESAPAGRFQGLKGGLDGFKAKRRTADNSQSDVAVENEKTKPAPDNDASTGGRFKSLKEGLANRKANKTGAETPASNEKMVHEDRSPGFIQRIRWIWDMA